MNKGQGAEAVGCDIEESQFLVTPTMIESQPPGKARGVNDHDNWENNISDTWLLKRKHYPDKKPKSGEDR